MLAQGRKILACRNWPGASFLITWACNFHIWLLAWTSRRLSAALIPIPTCGFSPRHHAIPRHQVGVLQFTLFWRYLPVDSVGSHRLRAQSYKNVLPSLYTDRKPRFSIMLLTNLREIPMTSFLGLVFVRSAQKTQIYILLTRLLVYYKRV